jgi:hypothetical protein
MHKAVAVHRYREAAFAIHEASYPFGIELFNTRQQGFLLIVRTGWIFTDHVKP